MKKLIAQREFKYDREKHGVKIAGKSLTVPDETMSVQEMFRRVMAGLPVGGGKMAPQYDENATFDSEDLEKVRDMDLVEKDEYKGRLAQDMLDKERRIKDYRDKQKRELEDKESEVAELRRLLQERKKPSGTTSGPPTDESAS